MNNVIFIPLLHLDILIFTYETRCIYMRPYIQISRVLQFHCYLLLYEWFKHMAFIVFTLFDRDNTVLKYVYMKYYDYIIAIDLLIDTIPLVLYNIFRHLQMGYNTRIWTMDLQLLINVVYMYLCLITPNKNKIICMTITRLFG